MKLINSSYLIGFFISCFFILDINNVQASTTITLNPIADTYVDQTSPGTNFGSSNSMVIGHTDNTNHKEAFIKFDLSSVPVLSHVESATLYLHQVTGIPCEAASENPYINSVDAAWVESTLTWNNRQMSYGGTNGYLNLMCSDNYVGSDITLSVQQIVDGVVPNYGFRLGSGFQGGWMRNFDTRESGSNVPYLEVVYSASTDVIGPTIFQVSISPGDTEASITWNTNEYATSEVRMAITEAGLTSGYESSLSTSYVFNHSISVDNLSPATLYYVRIFSTDVHGNSTSQDTTVTTLVSPTSIPPTSTPIPSSTPNPPTATNTPAPTQIVPTATVTPVHTQVPPTPTPTRASSQNNNLTSTPSPTRLPLQSVIPSITPSQELSITPTPDTTGSPTPTIMNDIVTSTSSNDSDTTTSSPLGYILGGLLIIIMSGIGGLIYYFRKHPGTNLKSLLTGIFKKPLPKDDNV